uniref:glucose/galactose MFS transporter n=1 Tax=uncultured Draconibacterium sp. TaxID=1573823 RepID=UPI003217B9DA
MDTTKTYRNWENYIFPMIIIAILFSVLGFAVGINAFFVPFVKAAFHISTAKSYLVTTATFSAFVLFGMPSGKILIKAGYKRSMFIAFLLMALGMFFIVPAAKWISFPVFLLALFINGMGQTLLNTTVNPYVTFLGSERSAAQRISIMGICNKLSFGFAPVVLAIFIDTVNVQLNDAIVPFYVITSILVLLGVLSLKSPLPELKAHGEEEYEIDNTSGSTNLKTSVFQFPHLLLGALGIFFYVGVEVIALVSINDFATEMGLPSPEQYVGYTSGAMVVGYLLGVFLIPKFISQCKAFKICALTGIFSAFLIVTLPIGAAIYFVALLGLANSLIWPAIWPLALADLGKFTKAGSSLLVMGIAGGGLLPLMLGFLKDLSSYQQAYWLLLPIYLYFLFYAIKGHKIRINFEKAGADSKDLLKQNL